MTYNSHNLKLTAGVWRQNGPQITAQGGMALRVADIRSPGTAGNAPRSGEETQANARAIAEVPRLIQALAMLLVETRNPGTYASGAAADAAARALRRATGVDQTPAVTREIADTMQAEFNADGTP